MLFILFYDTYLLHNGSLSSLSSLRSISLQPDVRPARPHLTACLLSLGLPYHTLHHLLLKGVRQTGILWKARLWENIAHPLQRLHQAVVLLHHHFLPWTWTWGPSLALDPFGLRLPKHQEHLIIKCAYLGTRTVAEVILHLGGQCMSRGREDITSALGLGLLRYLVITASFLHNPLLQDSSLQKLMTQYALFFITNSFRILPLPTPKDALSSYLVTSCITSASPSSLGGAEAEAWGCRDSGSTPYLSRYRTLVLQNHLCCSSSKASI